MSTLTGNFIVSEKMTSAKDFHYVFMNMLTMEPIKNAFSKEDVNKSTKSTPNSPKPPKRIYLSDFKDLTIISFAKLFLLQILKSTIVCCTPVYLEYIAHLDKLMLKNEESDDEDEEGDADEEFDWISRLDPIIPNFSESLFRNIVVDMFLVRMYSHFSIELFSNRIADKLIKSTNNSLKRKMLKYTLFEACTKGFYTYVRGGAILTASNISFDIFEIIADGICDPQDESKNPSSILNKLGRSSFWLIKRLTWHTSSLIVGSLGRVVGIYLFNSIFGITTGSQLGEVGFQVSQNFIVDIFLKVFIHSHN